MIPEFRLKLRRILGRWRITEKLCPVCGGFLYRRSGACSTQERANPDVRYYPMTEYTCLRCDRLAVKYPWVPDNDRPPETVTPYLIDEKGRQWITCPCCSMSFPVCHADPIIGVAMQDVGSSSRFENWLRNEGSDRVPSPDNSHRYPAISGPCSVPIGMWVANGGGCMILVPPWS